VRRGEQRRTREEMSLHTRGDRAIYKSRSYQIVRSRLAYKGRNANLSREKLAYKVDDEAWSEDEQNRIWAKNGCIRLAGSDKLSGTQVHPLRWIDGRHSRDPPSATFGWLRTHL